MSEPANPFTFRPPVRVITTASMDPIVNIGIKAARRAGSLMIRYQDRLEQVSVEKKGRRDFVSEIDRLAEEEIIAIIRQRYPGHRILAEESGSNDGESQPGNDVPEWIIDPLDGTTNFLHTDPHFAVSIGVRTGGILEHAVIYDPLRDELFTASRNQGAQLNSRRIRVSGKGSLNESLLGTGFSVRNLYRTDNVLRVMRALLPKVSNLKVSGSAALDLAYVACGRLDGYWEQGINAWDMAAGCLLVREAGGLVADFSGGQDFLERGDVVAANQRLFNELLTIVKSRFEPAP